MKKDRFKFIAVANFIVERENKVLLMYREDGFFKGGYWVLPGGHIDGYETARHAAVRELKEELDICVLEDNVKFVHIVHNLAETLERFDLFFKVNKFEGNIRNVEDDKCKKVDFFSYDNLPPKEKISDTTLLALKGMQQGKYYSERGFIEGNKGFSDSDKLSFERIHNFLCTHPSFDLNAPTIRERLKNELLKEDIDIGIMFLLLSKFSQLNNKDIRQLIYNSISGFK